MRSVETRISRAIKNAPTTIRRSRGILTSQKKNSCLRIKRIIDEIFDFSNLDMVGYIYMQQKNIFLMLALSGSVLMMMLVSVLFFVPTPSGLQANITSVPVGSAATRDGAYYSGRDPDEILKTIQEYVQSNDPDAAKKLYNELYSAEQQSENTMGGEIASIQ